MNDKSLSHPFHLTLPLRRVSGVCSHGMPKAKKNAKGREMNSTRFTMITSTPRSEWDDMLRRNGFPMVTPPAFASRCWRDRLVRLCEKHVTSLSLRLTVPDRGRGYTDRRMKGKDPLSHLSYPPL